MRLCDLVAQAVEPLLIEDPGGVRHMPGPADDAQAMRNTPIRYILDERAIAHCMAVLATDPAMFVAENMTLRMPAARFWLEWRVRPAKLSGRLFQAGVLVDAAPDGRSGSIRSYWMREDEALDRAQARLLFDLDRRVNAADPARMSRPAAGELGALRDHVAAEIDPAWLAHLNRSGAGDTGQRQIASWLWSDLAITFLFSSVLASRAVVSREVDLARLNAARAKRGKPPLLDHLEVGLALGGLKALEGGTSGGGRVVPRLHVVRGHMVTRGGKKFWRCTHMRGDLGGTPVTKTVRVSGGLPMAGETGSIAGI